MRGNSRRTMTLSAKEASRICPWKAWMSCVLLSEMCLLLDSPDSGEIEIVSNIRVSSWLKWSNRLRSTWDRRAGGESIFKHLEKSLADRAKVQKPCVSPRFLENLSCNFENSVKRSYDRTKAHMYFLLHGCWSITCGCRTQIDPRACIAQRRTESELQSETTQARE